MASIQLCLISLKTEPNVDDILFPIILLGWRSIMHRREIFPHTTLSMSRFHIDTPFPPSHFALCDFRSHFTAILSLGAEKTLPETSSVSETEIDISIYVCRFSPICLRLHDDDDQVVPTFALTVKRSVTLGTSFSLFTCNCVYAPHRRINS